MRKAFVAIIIFAVLLLVGCVVSVPENELTTAEPDGSAVLNSSESEMQSVTEQTEAASSEVVTLELTDVSENSSAELSDVSSDVVTEESSVALTHEQMTEIESVTENTTMSAVKETEEQTVPGIDEITLDISMPEKNGTMMTDCDKDNKYIKIVCKKRGIDSGLLVAVFSVPESGQNYVFEYKDEDGRTADDIRRVYLIDSNGKITGVAAVSASEKENISAVENWFCMNVLIKEVIYPAIKDKIV